MPDTYPNWAQSLQNQLRKLCEDESSDPCWLPPHLAIEALDDYGTLQMENAALKAEAVMLRETMLAAAEEIGAHWDAHCDSDGYGPVNLERRLKEGLATSYPGYSIGKFARLEEENATCKRHIAQLDKYNAVRLETKGEHEDAKSN